MTRLTRALLSAAFAALKARSCCPPARRVEGPVVGVRDHTALVKSSQAERIRRLNEVKDLGVDTLRVEVKWNEVAPNPARRPSRSSTPPTRPPTRHPNAYPGFGGYDDLVRRARAMGFRIIITITGDAPLGDRRRQGHRLERQLRPSAGEFAQFAAAVAKRYSGDLGDLPAVLLHDLERAQPPPVHQAAEERAGDLPQDGRRGDPEDPRREQERAHLHRRDGAGRPRAEGDGTKEFIRKWLCWTRPAAHLQGLVPELQADRRRLRAPPLRPHLPGPADPRRPQHAGDPHARQVPRPRGRGAPDPAQAADLQHRVRAPVEPARPGRQHLAGTPGAADQREGGILLPVRAPEELLAVPAARRPAAKGPRTRSGRARPRCGSTAARRSPPTTRSIPAGRSAGATS